MNFSSNCSKVKDSMALSFHLFVFMHFLLTLLSSHHLILTNCSSSVHQLCHENERLALLQFKQSFSIDKSASDYPSAYPKADSWGLQGNNSSDIDCCLWDGIECDDNSGHVIGLDLRSSLLYGSINSSSSLFNLAHLRMLNLADNHFNHSQIPSTIGHLSGLRSLNLSKSVFSGQIPSEILYLSRLASLDLSYNVNPLSSEHLLKLEKPNLRSLVLNLTSLKELSLSMVNVSSKVPNILSNLSSLTSLFLEDCGLYGEFPIDIFHLPKLQALNAQSNQNLNGSLPEFNQSSGLVDLRISDTNFAGTLPNSIGNLKSLNVLILYECYFMGSIPSSLGNLTHLTVLKLSDNNFHGPIPQSIFTLSNLRTLNLFGNNLSGIVEIDMFLKLKDLRILQLSDNEISVVTGSEVNITLPKFEILGLAHCKLNKFPEFLRYQDELEVLSLNHNKIYGLIPKWIWNIGPKTLLYIELAFNFLTGFEQLPAVLPWERLRGLKLSSNLLQGSLPIPPFSISSYQISNNSLAGEIPPLICNASFLQVLDLSNNNLSGKIPQCLSSFSDSLIVLNLQNNNFHGRIPQPYNKENNLKVVDLSQNRFDGSVPRSLVNCTKLEFLNLGNNQIHDIFPYWVGTLLELKILVLASNRFHGTIAGHMSKFEFPKLRIIDLSHNDFMGDLPSKYFQNWNATKIPEVGQPIYYQAEYTFHESGLDFPLFFTFSMTLRNKGLQISYTKILTIFAAIDFSSNKFNGEIPESIGNLKGLQLLNLSNNGFTYSMPSSLGNLTDLEALDVSQNELSGEIPQLLVQLTFLEFLNVSHNHLIGAIPRGNQFDNFENNSFDGNPELCGGPLSKKCGSARVSPLPAITLENGNSNFPSKFDWIFICMGYGSGLVVGLVIGHILTTRKHEWFVETFARRQQKTRKKKRAQRG